MGEAEVGSALDVGDEDVDGLDVGAADIVGSDDIVGDVDGRSVGVTEGEGVASTIGAK